jgi:hypothetical protein
MQVLRILLAVVLVWMIAKTGDVMIRADSMDRLLFKEAGLEWCFWLLASAIVFFEAMAIVYLWRPSRLCYIAAQLSVLLELAEGTLATLICLKDPKLAPEIYVASRQSRGLYVDPALARFLESPVFVLLTSLVWVAFLAALIGLIYLVERRRSAAMPPPPPAGLAGP